VSPLPFETWPRVTARSVVGYRDAVRTDPPAIRRAGRVQVTRHVVLSLPPGAGDFGVRRSKLQDLKAALRRATDVMWRVEHDGLGWPTLRVTWSRAGGCRGGVRLVLTTCDALAQRLQKEMA
jgi:hypothetical protein